MQSLCISLFSLLKKTFFSWYIYINWWYFKKPLASFYGWGSTVSRLCRATMRWHFTFYHSFLRSFWDSLNGLVVFFLEKTKLYGPLIWMGFISLKTTESLWGNSLLFTSQFSGVPGTHLIKEGLKVELILEPPNGFELGTPGLGVQCLNH